MADNILEVVLRGTQIFDLAQPLHPKSPCPAGHPGFRFSLMKRHGDVVRSDGVSASNELMMMGGHAGTHIDGLSHISCNGRLFGGIVASEVQDHAGFSCLGIETVEPVISRGVLLDICALHGVERLPNAHPVSSDELKNAALRANIKIGKGDVVLLRTGWAQLWDDAHAFIGEGVGVPGPTEDAAHWLADLGIRMTGSDTSAYEHVAPVRSDKLPGHRVLIAEHGIHIIEMLNLEKLAAAKCSEFVFVMAPLKIVGATGSPIRPLAVISH
jgi:kynurenine formamidase